jgi:hypothetical protein
VDEMLRCLSSLTFQTPLESVRHLYLRLEMVRHGGCPNRKPAV